MHHDQARDVRSIRSTRTAGTVGRRPVRWDRVLQLRAQIAAGTYPLERWWTLAVDQMLLAVDAGESNS
jgi:hypothetical protein